MEISSFRIVRNTFVPLGKGKSVILTGFSGSGKSTLLEGIYHEAILEHGYGLYIPAPKRKTVSGIIPFGEKVEPGNISLPLRFFSSLIEEQDKGPGLNGAGELPLILDEAIENGTIREGAILLIDEIEIGFHPSLVPSFVTQLNNLVSSLSLSLVFTTHSIWFLRSAEEYLERVTFMKMERDDKGFVSGRVISDAMEEIYRDVALTLEDL